MSVTVCFKITIRIYYHIALAHLYHEEGLMRINKTSSIVRSTARAREPSVYAKIHDDYIRKILNHTEEAIRVMDASGRVVIYEPIEHSLIERTPNQFIIEEWFAGTDIKGMVDVHPELIDENPQRLNQGIQIQHVIKYSDLAGLPDGIYLEEVHLHISLASQNTVLGHPRFSEDTKTKISLIPGAVIAVEILDPRRSTEILYANISGVVYRVVPKRFPTPADEGVLIHIKDSATNVIETFAYDLTEFTEGNGRHGIRLYLSELAAIADEREEGKEELLKLQNDLRKRKEKIFEDGKKAGIAFIEADAKKRIDEATKNADEKLARAQELAATARQTKQNDWTNIILNVLKIGGGSLALYKLYKLQQK